MYFPFSRLLISTFLSPIRDWTVAMVRLTSMRDSRERPEDAPERREEARRREVDMIGFWTGMKEKVERIGSKLVLACRVWGQVL